ncbi:MAG: hypothetical protein JWQ07_1433, partial [Ramlibacter sp.]|nr:hypothetical protein [Ramlibacter sp.]
MHRTGHWLGMDLHDSRTYEDPSQLGD